MNQMNTPEVALAKALEFLKTNDEDNTIVIINEFIINSKKKYWTHNHEQLISILIDLSIKKNKLKLLKDGLNFYRGVSQNTNIDSLANILTKTKDVVEEKFLKAQKSYQGIKIDIQDLDSEDSPELLFLYSFDDIVDSKEKEELLNTQKFIWDTYKILLDLTKTNSKLLSLYAQILKSAFNFCKENKRKVEFKRLCDSVRGYLQTLIKTEKKQFFQNKVQISRPEVLKTLIQIRISLLDTATELEQWQEAFKTAEDIIFLMDKYEKQIGEDKTKKSIKIPPMMKLEFYMNIEKLLWISDYPLYHAYSTLLIRELSVKANKWIKLAKNVDKQNEAKLKLEKYDIQNINNKILLDALVTPYKNNYTNFLQVGNELLDSDKEIETQTCARMMNILKLNVVPSRANLFRIIESLNILEDSSCDQKIKELYYLLSTEKNPLNISKKGTQLVAYLKSNPKFQKYFELISKNLIVKSLILMSQNYDSVSFTRLEKIFPWAERFAIEEIISENSRHGILKCTIDHMNNLVQLKSEQGKLDSFNDNFNYFVSSVSKIACNIIRTKSENVLKLSNIKDTLYKEIHSFNTNSLGTYTTLIQNMEHTNKKLEVYLKEKENYKEELKETQAKKRKEEKQKAEEESRMMKELLKDEQKKKEFEAQLKKYLIERIKIYTNVLFFDGKKVKLDDLLKDLTKISDEQLIKLLEKEEFEFKTKKEKKFKQIQKDTDYLIREYRKRDYEVTVKNLIEEEKLYNQQLEEDEKKSYEQKIGSKSIILKFKNYKENYFNDIQQAREQDYNQKISEFTQSLNKKVHEDIKKDVGTTFKIWIDDFRKKQEEDAAKSSFNKPQFNSFMKKGDKFKADDNKPRSNITSGLTDFKKGLNFVATSAEAKPITKETISEFKKGERHVVQEPTPVKTTTEFAKGINVSAPEKKEFKKVEDTAFKRAEKTIEKVEDTGFKRGEKSEPISTSSTKEFTRGSNVQTKTEPKVEPKVEPKISIIKKGENVTPTTSTATSKPDAGFKRAIVTPSNTTTNTSAGFKKADPTPKKPEPIPSKKAEPPKDAWRK